jgi:uncharacterized protein YfaS (alpha-2-macroglobulin family)
VHVEKHAFKPGSTVTIVITKPNGHKKTITVTAGPKGGLNFKLDVPKGAQKGHYDVSVKGHKGHHKVKGSTGFKVTKS